MPTKKGFMQSPIEPDGIIRLSGSIERVIYSNEENGFAICELSTDADEIITITGTLPYIGEGDTVIVSGRWVHNPKYGRQFRVEQCEKELPADQASILRYLSSGAVKGIGPKTAQRIVEEFGEDTFSVMEKHPEWLATIRGITAKRAREIGEEFREQTGLRTAMLFFRDFFGAAATVRIYKRWGSAAVELARSNPYILCEEIEGIGFERADRMAAKLGLEQDSPDRIAGGIRYLLTYNAVQNGHTCLPEKKVLEGAAVLLGVDETKITDVLGNLIAEGKLKVRNVRSVRLIYDRKQYEAENYLAEKLILLDRLCPRMETVNIDSLIRREEAESGVRYAALQRKAISNALENGVMLLTGGPGTGKTTIVRALLHIFQSMDFEVALTAPTGRAAKRLSESTSHEAKTVHRLLEYGGDETGGRAGFHRNEKDLLDEEVIILDEASMVDTMLMYALLRAIKPGARIILIGDADQLPSVGAGNVLHDLLSSGKFSTVRLTEIFRQAMESRIVTNAHAINRGEMPCLDDKDNDFFFLQRGNDQAIAETVAQLCAVRLPRSYGELAIGGVQVITPSRKGETGTEHLNRILQQSINPPAPEKREHTFRELIYREGDRVMQVRNNYELEWVRPDGSHGIGVFNGDIGVVETVDNRGEYLEVRYDEKLARYDFTILEELEPAYAITVHKSQGCEYPIVVLPIGDHTPPMLLSRNLLYTAVTRAQRIVILVGSREALRRMVENHRQTMRYTGLEYRLTEGNA